MSYFKFDRRIRVSSWAIAWLWILCMPGLAESGERKNVLLICVDDLRPELGCYGRQYIQSPNIDRLAATGRLFRRHFVQAPTCGASRYTLLTGQYGGANNHALFARAERLRKSDDATESKVDPSMPAWFRQHGYVTVSVGKVSHHPGGRGGPDWNDDAILEMPESWDRHLMPCGPWKHPRGAMHGLANGEIRTDAGKMDVFQSVDGPDSIYPDGLITQEALDQLDQLARGDQPFFLAVGIIRPHLPFGSPAKYMQPYRSVILPPIPVFFRPQGVTTWHRSGEFMKYNRWNRDPNRDSAFADEVRRHYAACVSYADAQVGRLLERLDQLGIDDQTTIVLWGDHGWHLGEHQIWGKHALFEQSLHSPLIVRDPQMVQPGVHTNAIVETLDLFPTLCDLTSVPQPDFIDGVSLLPILKAPETPGHVAVSYTGKAKTIRNDAYRLILHNGGQRELYDHRSDPFEAQNVADANSEICERLAGQLESKLGH